MGEPNPAEGAGAWCWRRELRRLHEVHGLGRFPWRSGARPAEEADRGSGGTDQSHERDVRGFAGGGMQAAVIVSWIACRYRDASKGPFLQVLAALENKHLREYSGTQCLALTWVNA